MEKKFRMPYVAPITEKYNVGSEPMMIPISGETTPWETDAKEGTLDGLDEDAQDGLPRFNIWDE